MTAPGRTALIGMVSASGKPRMQGATIGGDDPDEKETS
jgi:hypothetical protein